MPNSEIYINNDLENFGRVWVHIQNVDGVSCMPYRVRMAFDTVDVVISPDDKPPSVSWDQYLREEVSELGSGMLSVFFEKLRRLSGADREQPRWVIATLDAVIEETHGIELQGRAVGFDPSRFLS
ncbi:hypothetical protein [Tuwongella immobilis]|uniref:Uncharacterized protein n=1 Tax=Tuwongella immobilis TaxID=692036 RepID=A0A6C2YH83_9BACT|nr:hypothetical protein [Tuwongella immobilis]VIP00767.1 unnamed protein product [Tuwongella immobilis]VTR96952.1 unnamed protein product [Tuwongella immobilis]